MGMTVTIGHNAANLGDAQLVVYSAAIHEDNPELQAPRTHGIPTVERAVLLGYVSRLYPAAWAWPAPTAKPPPPA